MNAQCVLGPLSLTTFIQRLQHVSWKTKTSYLSQLGSIWPLSLLCSKLSPILWGQRRPRPDLPKVRVHERTS